MGTLGGKGLMAVDLAPIATPLLPHAKENGRS